MQDRQKYFHLLGDVCVLLKPAAVDALVQAGYPLGASALENVRIGRSPNLQALVDLVRVSAPDYEIPESYLPAA